MSILKITAAAALTAAGLLATSANAATLLNIVDAPVGALDYKLEFVATDVTTSLSVGGYQVPNDEYISKNVVSTGGGPNLLGASWVFTPAASGSFSLTYNDGTSVPAINISAVSAGFYDVFTQTFATVVGDTYTYSFTFDEGHVGPSGFEVLVSTGTAVDPEPSPQPVPESPSWAMMALGFGALGGVMRRRRTTSPV